MAIPLHVRPLGLPHIPGALRLSTQAGWNQIDADWRRLIRLWPDGCLGGWCDDGTLVATATLATFDRSVGWVGMVLVDESCRGQGAGGAMMDAILATGQRAGIRLLGLDATDLGQPVYLKRGFVGQVPVERWSSTSRRSLTSGALPALHTDDWPALLALDRAACGVDRSALLRELAGEDGATVHAAWDGRNLQGVGFARRGRVADYLGPIVATDIDAVGRVIGSLLTTLPADRPVFIDVPRNPALEAILAGHGFAVARNLLRMTRPASEKPALVDPRIWSIAGLELG